MPLFSIIVPVYKAEKYINECVDSVLAQTFEDFELILADDGSPDRCPEICDEYAKKDSRIKVIHKENGGASSARNSGIEAACGEYVIFLDSDDYWEENYTLQRLTETTPPCLKTEKETKRCNTCLRAKIFPELLTFLQQKGACLTAASASDL